MGLSLFYDHNCLQRKKQKENKRIDNNNFGKRKRTKRNRQKGIQKKKITSMFEENGETTNEREEILSICSAFIKSYTQKQ